MNLATFDFESNAVRTLVIDGEPWFVGKDVCNCLEIADHHQALGRLDDDEKGWVEVPTPGGKQKMIGINEFGLYQLTFTSRTEASIRFKRWLAHEVLPAIRRAGRYEMPVRAQAGEARDIVSRGLNDDGRLALNIVREARVLFGKQAAVRLWPELGLPAIEADAIEESEEDDAGGIRAFARARLVRRLGERSEIAVVYAAYAAWCEVTGRRSLSRNYFSRNMTAFGIADKGETSVKGRHIRFFYDVAIGSDLQEQAHV